MSLFEVDPSLDFDEIADVLGVPGDAVIDHVETSGEATLINGAADSAVPICKASDSVVGASLVAAAKNVTVTAGSPLVLQSDSAPLAVVFGTLTLEQGAQIICECPVNMSVNTFIKK